MRWLGFLCVVWCAGVICGNLLASGVSIPTSLQQRTAVGQRIAEIYGGLLGQEIDFSLVFYGASHQYTGKIAKVILPDIREYIESGNKDDAELKLEVGEVQPEDPQDTDSFSSRIISAQDAELDHLNVSPVSLVEIDPGVVGERAVSHWVSLNT